MRELTYTVRFNRLTKLSRSMGRKAFPRAWWAKWLVLAIYLCVLIAFTVYTDAIFDFLASIGMPRSILPYGYFVLIAMAFAVFMLGFFLIRKSLVKEARARVNFDLAVHLVQDGDGIHIATDNIEYYLKWPGISQLLIEPDGVVISHGALFWLIPNTAFANPADRLGFIRDVYARLNDRARSISESHLRLLLEGDRGAKAT